MTASIQGTGILWTDGMTWTASLYRRLACSVNTFDSGTASAVGPAGGVYASPAQALQVTAGTGMSVNVSAGYCSVPSSASGQGTYIFGLMSSGSLAVAANSTGSTRLDYVVANVQDLGSPSSSSQVEYLTGTASPPAVPSNSIVLAQVSVPNGASSIISADITDLRSYTAPPGCIVPFASTGVAPAAAATQVMYNEATGLLVQGTGIAGETGSVALAALAGSSLVNTSTGHGIQPGTPASDAWGIGFGSISSGDFGKGFGFSSDTDGSQVTEMQVTFQADGQSDYEIYYKWGLVLPAEAWSGFGDSVTGGYAVLSVLLDGQQVDSVHLQASDSPSVLPGSGGSASWFSSAALGTTPGEGTHTASLAVASYATFAEDQFNTASGVSIGATSQNAAAVFGAPSGWRTALTRENCALVVSQVPPA